MTAWTDFVTKIFKEERKKNPAYQFKDAMKEASKRKSEMGSSSTTVTATKSKKRGKSRKGGKSKKSKKGGKSRKNK